MGAVFRQPLTRDDEVKLGIALVAKICSELAKMRMFTVSELKVAKLLFLTLYAKIENGEVVDYELPPFRPMDLLRFRIYLRGPFVRIRRIIEEARRSSDELTHRLGMEVDEIRDRQLLRLRGDPDEVDRMSIEAMRAVLRGYADYLIARSSNIPRIFASLDDERLTQLTLRVVYLDDPILKAMAIDLDVEGLLEKYEAFRHAPIEIEPEPSIP